MHGWRWVTVVRALSALSTLSAALSAASCDGKFDGPYACASGYASCTTTVGCETIISSDGANCGECGHACAPGATCLNGGCQSAPIRLVSTPSPQGLTIVGDSLLWLVSDAGAEAGPGMPEVESVSTGGGKPASILSLNSNSPALFAVDSSNVYWFGNSGSSNTTLLARPRRGGTVTTLAQINNTNLSFEELLLANGSLYWAEQSCCGGGNGGNGGNGNQTFLSVPVGGGATTTVATMSSQNNQGNFVVADGSLYFPPGCTNGNCNLLASIPTSGGAVDYLTSPLDDQGGSGRIVADTDNVYFVTSGWNCPNNNGMNEALSEGGNDVLTGGTTVVQFPLSGAPATILATTHDGSPVVAAAIDSAHLYWATATNAWSVPLAGGTPTPIAGNLSGGSSGELDAGEPVPCGNGGGALASPSMVSDGSFLYVAAPASNVIYKIPVP
jgi:hypothetical protein